MSATDDLDPGVGWSAGPAPEAREPHPFDNPYNRLGLLPPLTIVGDGYSCTTLWPRDRHRDGARLFLATRDGLDLRPAALLGPEPEAAADVFGFPADAEPCASSTRPSNSAGPVPTEAEDDPLRRPLTLRQWLTAVAVLLLFIAGLCLCSGYAPPEPR